MNNAHHAQDTTVIVRRYVGMSIETGMFLRWNNDRMDWTYDGTPTQAFTVPTPDHFPVPTGALFVMQRFDYLTAEHAEHLRDTWVGEDGENPWLMRAVDGDRIW